MAKYGCTTANRSIYVYRRDGSRVCAPDATYVYYRRRTRTHTDRRADVHTRGTAGVCLCGDPNEGRQASKLRRAAAARAAILLESRWKTSCGRRGSSVTDVRRTCFRHRPPRRRRRRRFLLQTASDNREFSWIELSGIVASARVFTWTLGFLSYREDSCTRASAVLVTGERSSAACTCATGRQVRERIYAENVTSAETGRTKAVLVPERV